MTVSCLSGFLPGFINIHSVFPSSDTIFWNSSLVRVFIHISPTPRSSSFMIGPLRHFHSIIFLVAPPRGIEPTISAVKGQRPKPLDDEGFYLLLTTVASPSSSYDPSTSPISGA